MFEGYIPGCCLGYILLSFLLGAFAGYAYRVNARRAVDDPKKRNYSPGAIFLVPFIWPLLLSGFICLFIIRMLTFGIILVLFAIGLVVIRKPFLLILLEKLVIRIGDRLLAGNTFLINLVLGDWGNSQEI